MPASSECDLRQDCYDVSDEVSCGPREVSDLDLTTVTPPGVIELDGIGGFYKLTGIYFNEFCYKKKKRKEKKGEITYSLIIDTFCPPKNMVKLLILTKSCLF